MPARFGVTLNARSVTGTGSRCNRSGIKHRRRADRVLVRVRTHDRLRTVDRPQRSTFIEVAGRTDHEVAATISDLAPNSVTHYRICTEGSDGLASCSNDRTLTTGFTGRDTVSGSGTVFAIPELGYSISASANASSAPDGGSPLQGSAATSPGVLYFRIADIGTVTCLRVSGNRGSCRVRALPRPRSPIAGLSRARSSSRTTDPPATASSSADSPRRTRPVRTRRRRPSRHSSSAATSRSRRCSRPATSSCTTTRTATEAPSLSDLALLELLVEVAGLAQGALELAGGLVFGRVAGATRTMSSAGGRRPHAPARPTAMRTRSGRRPGARPPRPAPFLPRRPPRRRR